MLRLLISLAKYTYSFHFVCIAIPGALFLTWHYFPVLGLVGGLMLLVVAMMKSPKWTWIFTGNDAHVGDGPLTDLKRAREATKISKWYFGVSIIYGAVGTLFMLAQFT